VTETKSVGIVVAIYNEEEPLPQLLGAFRTLFNAEPDYEFKVYFIENGSNDNSESILSSAISQDSRFGMIKLSRNFRMDGALTAGLQYVTEDACVLMAGDMQDPPFMISTFLRLWEQGYENIYGVITKRDKSSVVRRINSQLFYWLAGALSDNRLPKNASDFRLVDSKVYETVRDMRERNRFVRGLFAWSGFRSIGVPMVRPPRAGGDSKASTLKVIDLALKGIFAHTIYPLKIISFCGLTIFLGSLVVLLWEFSSWVLKGVPFAGYGVIVTILLLGVGGILLALGVISEYIGLIYEEVKQRPNYIVSKTFNIID
jgi:dolichol-phosphate mannosyltransferase